MIRFLKKKKTKTKRKKKTKRKIIKKTITFDMGESISSTLYFRQF